MFVAILAEGLIVRKSVFLVWMKNVLWLFLLYSVRKEMTIVEYAGQKHWIQHLVFNLAVVISSI